MKNQSKLEKLCRPVLELLCNYCSYAKSETPLNAETLKKKIHLCMNDIAVKCEEDPVLKREFSRIERPLVFFIDYTIKEGQFPFSNEWKELARNYNELSGDEKFFDVLTENLDDPEASDRLRFFYLLMGLGFDGAFANDKEYVERRMKLCATRFTMPEKLTAESLFAMPSVLPEKRSGKSRLLVTAFIITLVFALGAFSCNFYKFRKASSHYKKAVDDAVQKATPAYVEISKSPLSGMKK